MELKLLLKNTSYLVTTRIVQFFIGIIKSKLIAVFLGTLGAGIFAQLSDVVQKMSSFTLMSVNDGLVKQIAQNRNDEGFAGKLASLLKSYIAIITVISAISIVLLYIFSKDITVYVFGDIKYYNYYLIGILSFPILIINSISFALLKGAKEIKYIARSQLLVIAINFIFFVPLIYFWGITGIVIYLPLSLLSVLVINNHYAKTKVLNKYNVLIKDIFSSDIKKKSVKELFVFIGFGISSGAALLLSEIACRSVVVTQLGVDQIGIYSPLVSWAGLFTGFILPSVSTYLYPRFSEAKADKEISGVLNDVLRLVTFLMLPLLFLSIPIRYEIIPLFYSKEFISAGKYLPWHFIGILFYLWTYALGAVLTPTGRIKTYGVLVIIMSLLNFIVVYYFVPLYGLYGWMLKFIISPVLFFIFYLFYLRRVINFRVESKNVFVMFYVFAISLLLIVIDKYVISDYRINLIAGICFMFISFWFMSASERSYIIKVLKRKK